MTVTNAMAGATIQPKFSDVEVWSIVCTQAIASAAASGENYKLFYVSSGATILDVYLRLATACSTAASLMHVGLTSGGSDFVASAAQSVTTVARATKGLPYACTADQLVYLNLDVGATTAASNAIVTVLCINTQNVT